MEWGRRFVDDVFVVCHKGSFVDVAFLDRIDIIECVVLAVSDVFLEAYYILHNMYVYIYHMCV